MRAFMQNLSPEQREKLRAINAELGIDFRNGPPSPEQREQLRKLMVERGVITAEQAAEMAGRSAAPGEVVITTRTIYRLPGGNKDAKPEPVTAKIGITDGIASEVVDGLKEGDTIITGIAAATTGPAAAPTANPFSGGRRF